MENATIYYSTQEITLNRNQIQANGEWNGFCLIMHICGSKQHMGNLLIFVYSYTLIEIVTTGAIKKRVENTNGVYRNLKLRNEPWR
jgi:hypothetical protein